MGHAVLVLQVSIARMEVPQDFVHRGNIPVQVLQAARSARRAAIPVHSLQVALVFQGHIPIVVHQVALIVRLASIPPAVQVVQVAHLARQISRQ